MKTLSRIWPVFVPLLGGLSLLAAQLWAKGNTYLWYITLSVVLAGLFALYLRFEWPRQNAKARRATINGIAGMLPILSLLLFRWFHLADKPYWLSAYFALVIVLAVWKLIYRKGIFSKITGTILIGAMLYAIYTVNF